jgi:hypothetical protein
VPSLADEARFSGESELILTVTKGLSVPDLVGLTASLVAEEVRQLEAP